MFPLPTHEVMAMNSKTPFLRSALVLTVAVAFAGCQDESLPSQPNSPTMPGPSTAFVDASTSPDVDGFFWQPPIVKDAEGENNRDLSPVVVVCRAEDIRDEKFCDANPETDTGAPNEDALATLPAELSDEEVDRYEAVFLSKQFPSLEVGDVVRILAFRGDPLPGEEPAGWFDVKLTDPDTKTKGNKKLIDDDEDGTLELQLGSALPATFRMSDALFCSQENIDDGFCFVGTFSNDEGGSGSSENGFIALDVDPDFIPQEKVDVGVDEVTFILERVERSEAPGEGCLDGADDPFPLQERDLCVRGATAPDMMEFPFKADPNGDSRVTLGMCFDDSGLSQDEEEQFQGWDADEIGGATVRTPLRGVAAPSELDCSGFVAAALDDGPVMRYARSGLESLRDFFIGPAVALNAGFGHSVMTFSRIVYARSLVLTDLSGDLEASPSAMVDVTVRVTRPPNTSSDHHFDSEAGSTPTSDYPDDDDLFDDGGDGPLDEAIAAAPDEGVNGIELDVAVTEGSAPATATTATVDGEDGVATFEVTMPAETENETVTVIVEGPALGTPVTIPIDVDVPEAPAIANLAPSPTLAEDVDFIFNGSGDGVQERSIVFDANDPDDNITAVVVEAVDPQTNSFELLDDVSGGSKVVDPNLGGGEFDPADGEYTTTITVVDDDELQASESIEYTLDTTDPVVDPGVTPPADTATNNASLVLEVGAFVNDDNELTEASVEIFEQVGEGCGDGDVIPLDEGTGPGDVDDQSQSVLDQTSFNFTVDFEIQHPGQALDITYCLITTVVDEALDNTGSPDGNTEVFTTSTDVVWDPAN